MDAKLALAVAGLGAVGSFLRWVVANAIQKASGSAFPWGTLCVNLAGSAAIGAVMALFALRGELDSRARLALTAGLLGGFTTYSAYAYETVELLERRSFGQAAAYVALTLLGSATVCFAAIALIRK